MSEVSVSPVAASMFFFFPFLSPLYFRNRTPLRYSLTFAPTHAPPKSTTPLTLLPRFLYYHILYRPLHPFSILPCLIHPPLPPQPPQALQPTYLLSPKL